MSVLRTRAAAVDVGHHHAQTLMVSVRANFNIGGRKSRLGSSVPPGKSPRIKQGPVGGVAKRIHGTTRVEYTNKKGRTYSFSIPVAELTHPPTLFNSPSASGWVPIDTSFCDLGDLEDDMPSRLSELLASGCCASSSHGSANGAGGDEETGSDHVGRTAEEVRGLQSAFVSLCKEYVLMDTRGMKTSLTYSELNSGPDYEMYDRKSMRKRYWISLRRRFHDVKDLLWPPHEGGVANSGNDSNGDVVPTLSACEMLEALVWIEAAGTLCVRKRQPYDVADAVEFTPLELGPQLRVLARQVRETGGGVKFFQPLPTDPDGGRAVSDRFVSCAALCARHEVPFSEFFSPTSHEGTPPPALESKSFRLLVTSLPPIQNTVNAIRVMALLQVAAGPRAYEFSDTDGTVSDAELLSGIAQVCSTELFGEADALRDVDEAQLCIILQYAVAVWECNSACLRHPGSTSAVAGTLVQEQLSTLRSFTRQVISRCRHLLYKLGGPQETLSSGDDERVPLVELQQFAERSHPQALVHYTIGTQNAPGLRAAALHATSSAALLELVDRLEAAMAGEGAALRTLSRDLVHDFAQKAALNGPALSLSDVLRVLPLLPKVAETRAEVEGPLSERHRCLLASTAATVGARLHSVGEPDVMVSLLSGFAACRYLPSCYPQLEAVALRMTARQCFSIEHFTRSLSAMLRLVGPAGVSQVFVRHSARAVAGLCAEDTVDCAAVLALLRVMRHCRYDALPSLIVHVLAEADTPLARGLRGCGAAEQCGAGVLLAYAAAVLPDDDAACAPLCERAKTLLTQDSPDACRALRGDRELLADYLTACAALGVDSMDTEQLRACLDDRDSASAVHVLCTPLMAVGVLESLEALQVADTALHATYERYIARALTQLLAAAPPGDGGGGGGLLPDDASMSLRVLQLQSINAEVACAAARLLQREVVRLDSHLSGAADRDDGAPTSSSFEHTFLRNQLKRAQVEETMLAYCAAIQNNSATANLMAEG